jgi:hypothetical protein
MTSEAQRRATTKYHQTEKSRAVNVRYRQNEKGKISDARASKRYRQSEKGKSTDVRHARTEKGKITQARKYAKRKRDLGFKPMNNWFPECNGHHIDKVNVLFIPEKLHKSISHRQDDLVSMQRINDAAFEWLCTTDIL